MENTKSVATLSKWCKREFVLDVDLVTLGNLSQVTEPAAPDVSEITLNFKLVRICGFKGVELDQRSAQGSDWTLLLLPGPETHLFFNHSTIRTFISDQAGSN